jgi:hypothetical protein
MQGSLIKLTCWIASLDGSRILQESAVGTAEDAEQVAMALEVMLRSRGAADIIGEIRMQVPWIRPAKTAAAKPTNGKARGARPRKKPARLVRRAR